MFLHQGKYKFQTQLLLPICRRLEEAAATKRTSLATVAGQAQELEAELQQLLSVRGGWGGGGIVRCQSGRS